MVHAKENIMTLFKIVNITQKFFYKKKKPQIVCLSRIHIGFNVLRVKRFFMPGLFYLMFMLTTHCKRSYLYTYGNTVVDA